MRNDINLIIFTNIGADINDIDTKTIGRYQDFKPF